MLGIPVRISMAPSTRLRPHDIWPEGFAWWNWHQDTQDFCLPIIQCTRFKGWFGKKVLPFLRRSNRFPFEKVVVLLMVGKRARLNVCEEHLVITVDNVEVKVPQLFVETEQSGVFPTLGLIEIGKFHLVKHPRA